MAFKFIVFATVLAYAKAGNIIGASLAAGPLAYTAGIATHAVAAPVAVARAEPYDPNPQYQFGYDVQDALTGDSKSQIESRSGDVVQGQYSLNDPDGTRRTVDYTADPINGFNAVVRKEPLVAKTVVAAHAAPVLSAPLIRSAPLIAQPAISAPLIRSAPLIAQQAISAPLIHSAPLLAQTSYGSPLIRSAPLLAQPALTSSLIHSAPLLSQPAIAGSLIRSAPLIAQPAYAQSSILTGSPLIRSAGIIAHSSPLIGQSAYAAPTLLH